MNRVEAHRANLVAWAMSLFCAGISVYLGASFLPHQGLWGDEVTQLSGLTLGPFELLGWLSGADLGRFGVPDDRMPPLSYFVGMLWGFVFGEGATALRWLGVCCVALATVVVSRTAYRSYGVKSALIAGLLFALAPNVVYQSVTIRAYPLFILLSACAMYLLVRLVEALPEYDKGTLVGLVVVLVLASYTHYYGLVLAAGVLGAALLLTGRGRRGPIIWCIAVAGVAVLGLIPFVLGALQVSSGAPGHPGGGGEVMRLLYRLCGHPSMWVNKYLTVAGLASFALLAALSLCGKRSGGRTHHFIALALGVGISIVVCANFFVTGLDATRPSYNNWMFPGLSILLGSGFAARNLKVRVTAFFAVVVMVASYVYGDYQLARNGDYFAHTPFNKIEGVIEELGRENVAIVHDLESDNFRAPYWPTWFTYGMSLEQFIIVRDSNDPSRLAVASNVFSPDVTTDGLALDFKYLFVIRAQMQSANALSEQIRKGDMALGDGHAARTLSASPKWRKREELLFVSFVKCDIDIFERVADGSSQ